MINKWFGTKVWLWFTATVCFTFGSLCMAELPAEIEVDRFILAAKKHIEQGNYGQAEQYLQKAIALQVTPPDEFYFIYGKVLFKNKKMDQAQENIERYLKRTGKEGEYYQEALGMFTDIEEFKQKDQQKKAAISSVDKSDVIKIEPSEMDKVVNRLKAQYKTSSEIIALEKYINEMLAENALRKGKVINLNKEADELYTINAKNLGELIVTKVIRTTDDGGKQLQNAILKVYGVTTDIKYSCTGVDNICWIKHPVTMERWIAIRGNQSTANKLTTFIAELIKYKQKEG
ncbi:tetratricopeptide repeat protein [Zooshikella marina]|uniref:tetratricopeptide repeat protein n=1 Tax=Zooshikella ganghwensis TaxID=202772 RepID=UPI001BAEAE99|nr:tetratricopeptide repeat protein [Zooshikella ganghwensis]MBU2706262.1 tetratricopeptide repeat protein [Zooshikella ganghwensis]